MQFEPIIQCATELERATKTLYALDRQSQSISMLMSGAFSKHIAQ